MFCAGIAITIGFLIVIVNLSYVIFVKGTDYKQAAYAQQTKSQIISSSRGTIFDRNGEILAISVSVDTVSFNPGKIKYSNGKKVEDELIAQKFSELFGISYEEALEKVQSTSKVVVIARKVETSVVNQLTEWMAENKITSGINIDEDFRRYYPNDTLASTLIGFCGTDNSGLTGLEEKWNSVLVGTPGKVTVTSDVNGEAISDDMEEYVPAENGSNLYLTIDSTIQGIAEKYLKKAVQDNQADFGGVILMNPQNGDILAMANYPDYNLNDPQNPEPTGLASNWDTLDATAKNNAKFALWNNRNVSSTYEPGSTFKLIVSAIALEEGIVETDTEGDFYCNQYMQVGDRQMHCWSKVAHGPRSLRQALEKSCNPSFIQLGQRIGIKTMYKYFKAFGFFDKCGNNIASPATPIFHNESEVREQELATISYGQRFNISPLQLITATSAVVNGGTLVEPRIVKQIENTDTGSIKTTDTKEIRKVISEETSNQIKDMMKSVVTEGTGGYAAIDGYEIGGKSGTSEPMPGREEQDGYTSSFMAISPVENTQVICLIMVHHPKGLLFQGGQVCGPVAAEILSEVLPYLNVTNTNNGSENGEINTAVNTSKAVIDVKGLTVASARAKLETNGFKVLVNVADENSTLVTDQMPKSGAYLENGSTVYLYTSDNDVRTSVQVPDIKGLSKDEAVKKLQENKLNVVIEGTSGVVVSQNISNAQVEEETVVTIVVKEQLTEAQ